MPDLTRARRRLLMIVLTAFISLLPGIVSLAAGTADRLQILVNDTAAQLQLAYRQHPDERARRQEQLAAAVAAWRSAPRSEANNERLAGWLRAAILNSMPGSQEALPALPSFAAMVTTEPRADRRESTREPQAAATAI